MRIITKYKKHVFLLAFMCLMFIVQAKAQFFDDDGPGDFDPPPDNDVPLDSYQWVMLFLALAYGVFVFWKHYKKSQKAATEKLFGCSATELKVEAAFKI